MKDFIKKVIVLNLVAAIGFFAGTAFAFSKASDTIGVQEVKINYPTGYEVLNELNKYRVNEGYTPLVLDQYLCNNIAARWQNYRLTNSHDGFYEFADMYMPGRSISEILVSGNTASEMVQKWTGSPSHDLFIKNNSKVCVYSIEGAAVALLSN